MSELRALGKVAGDYFAQGLGVIEGVHRASSGLTALAETERFARFLDLRSAGIRDLCLTCDAPPFEGAGAHYAARRSRAVTTTRWAGLSATCWCATEAPRRARRTLATSAGAIHFHLLNDPEIYEALRTWLAEPSSRAGASPQSCSSR